MPHTGGGGSSRGCRGWERGTRASSAAWKDNSVAHFSCATVQSAILRLRRFCIVGTTRNYNKRPEICYMLSIVSPCGFFKKEMSNNDGTSLYRMLRVSFIRRERGKFVSLYSQFERNDDSANCIEFFVLQSS